MTDTLAKDEGAPIAKDAIDPDLVKLRGKRPKVGIVTAAGLVFLCGFFIVRLWPDRSFGSSGATPTKVAVADLVAGKGDLDSFVTVDAQPLVSHAIRAAVGKTQLGLRVVPARGTNDKLWFVVSGDGWSEPSTAGYTGRLRRLRDLPFAPAVTAYAEKTPRPMFAPAAAVRAGFATNTVKTVGGDTVTIADTDTVALDVIEPNTALVVASFNERLPDAAAWKAALARAGLAPTTEVINADLREVRYTVELPDAVASAVKKLETAELLAARVDPVSHHYVAKWADLKASPAGQFALAPTMVAESSIDLVGLFITKPIPSDALVIIANEKPADYWYVLPITIGLFLIGFVFVWALVRAVRRDLLAPPSA